MDEVKLVTLLLFVVSAELHVADGQPVVNVSQGMLVGKTVNFKERRYLNVDVEINTYLGIPYAEQPVRFRPPVEPTSWEGVWNATYARDACSQPVVPSSEDCLYLNVYVPESVVSDAAVMVWFHGGAYHIGFSTSPLFDPVALLGLAGDMIFVSVNYRLGLYGFLSTGDDASPGNYGLMDQQQALKWINNNIAAFGGDPAKVTIVGESAGAASVSAHLLSPNSRGLFNQAIMQSGTLLSPWGIDTTLGGKRSIKMAQDLARPVDCPTDSNTEMVSCLRTKSESLLTREQGNLILSTVFNDLPFKPVVDKNIIPDRPEILLQKAALNPADMILGTNRDEATLFALGAYFSYLNSEEAPEIPLHELRDLLPVVAYDHNHPQLHRAMEQFYIDWSVADNATTDHFQAFVAMMSDLAFICPYQLMPLLAQQ